VDLYRAGSHANTHAGSVHPVDWRRAYVRTLAGQKTPTREPARCGTGLVKYLKHCKDKPLRPDLSRPLDLRALDLALE
jgi:hypothetical protein